MDESSMIGGAVMPLLLFVCLALFTILVLPVTAVLQADNRHQLTVTIAWQVGPWHLKQQRILPRTNADKPSKPDVSRLALIHELRRSGHGQHIGRHIRLDKLSISASLSLSDAARSAQLCGFISTLPNMLPVAWMERVSICVLPDFWSGRQTVAAECILSSHVGILIADAARVLLIRARLRRQQHKEAT